MFLKLYFAPVGMWGIAISRSSVCLSVRPLAYLWNHTSKFLLFVLLVAKARSSSDGTTICYVLPGLWLSDTCFVELPVGGPSETSDNVIWSSSPGGSTGGEVCRLRLHFVQDENLRR